MDTTETTDPIVPDYPLPPLVIDQEGKYYLHTAGRWATFLGIFGFVITGFILLGAIFVGTLFSLMGRFNPAMNMPSSSGGPAAASILNAASSFISFFYVLIAVFYFFLSYYLYRFGTGIKKSTMFNDTATATKSLEYLKSHFKLIGITTIVVISLYLLLFIGIILVSVFAASALHQ
jgi:hypothetical protein